MQSIYRFPIITSFCALLILVGCSSSGGGSTAPTANASADQTTTEDTLITLSGTATAGSNAVASVAWTQTGGPAVTLNGANTDTPSFTAPKAPIKGTVTVELRYTVTDTGGLTGSDSVAITVTSTDFAVFIADKDTLGVRELYKSDVENDTITKLSGPLVTGGVISSFKISPDGLYVAYTAFQDTLGLQEVYVARTDGTGFVKASGTMVAGGGAQPVLHWAPDSSRIAYFAVQDTVGVLELYTSLPNGTGNARINGLLVAGGNVFNLSSTPWAPDSSRIAYMADQDTDGVNELYTSMPDGTGNVKVSGTLVAGGNVNPPSFFWAPDSSRIAYLANQDSLTVTELYTALPTVSATQKLNGLLVAGGDVFIPSSSPWAPDSSRIVYTADQDTDSVNELYSSRFDGSDNTKLNPALAAGAFVTNFAISPDGTRVAYTANTGGGLTELFASLIGGGGTVTLNGSLVAGGNVTSFHWAPDASRIAYVADQDTDNISELYTSLPDGTANVKISGLLPAATNVATNTVPAVPGDWAPDSSLVSYVLFGTALPFQIPGFAAQPDGTGSVRYTGVMDPTGSGLRNWPQWAPDSSRLMYVAQQDSATTTELYLSSPDGVLNQKISGPLVAGGNVGTATTDFIWK